MNRPQTLPSPAPGLTVSITVYVGGAYEPSTGQVVGGRQIATHPAPASDGGVLTIGRHPGCDILVEGATPAMSRQPITFVRERDRLLVSVRSVSGGTAYLGGRNPVSLPRQTDEDPQVEEVTFTVDRRLVIDVVTGSFCHAFVVCDVPRRPANLPGRGLPAPLGEPSRALPNVAYNLSAADRELLAALSPDRVVQPPFDRNIPSTPAQAVAMLSACAEQYFVGKGNRESYTTDKLKKTIVALVKRIDRAEELGLVETHKRLSHLLSDWNDSGHTGILGVDRWLELHPEVVADLPFSMAVEMSEVREREVLRLRAAQKEAGAIGAARSNAAREAARSDEP